MEHGNEPKFNPGAQPQALPEQPKQRDWAESQLKQQRSGGAGL
jgi:hypothetical protein